MALLNYSLKYETIKNDYAKNPSKLYFTGDGHIITHGIDYTPLFTSTNKGGLVSTQGIGENKILSPQNTWVNLTTNYLPLYKGELTPTSKDTDSILTTAQVVDFVSKHIYASDAMRFKGSLSVVDSAGNLKVNGTQPFPTTCEAGDTYRIAANGTYCGHKCSVGDLLMCIKDGLSGNIKTTEYWTAVESNISSLLETTLKINNLSYTFYCLSKPNSELANIYAPTSLGTDKQVLITTLTVDGNKLLEWTNISELVKNTWRPILINGTSIELQTLNIQPSGDLYFNIDNNSEDGIYNLSLGIGWYNVDTKNFETA